MMQIERCEVCGGTELRDVIDLGDHPMCDDLVPTGVDRQPQNYPIKIAFCPVCKTAHQMFQIPKQKLFPQNYHYRARHTADVLNGMRQLVQRCEDQIGTLQGLSVVDIGCNDGSLLSIFRERGVRTIGVEPTGAAADARAAGHAVHEDYFTPGLAQSIVDRHGRADIVTFTNVFAHVEDLPSVLQAVGTLMGPETLLVIENHYLGAVLDRFQFDTFYHEHPRTYSLTSFRHIAGSLGARLIAAEFPSRYGGNIRVMMRREARGGSEGPLPATDLVDETDFEARLRSMGARIPLWQQAKRAQIQAAVAQFGPLPGKAFPGRAAILVKLLGLDNDLIAAVYEKPGSMKVGHYLPGTQIPIRSDEDFPSRPNRDAPLLNLGWHISGEISTYMRKSGYEGEIIDIFSPEEFAAIE